MDLLLVVAVPVPKTGEVDKDTKINGESGKGETYETDSMADYEKYLEQKTAYTWCRRWGGKGDGDDHIKVYRTKGGLKKISKVHIRRRRSVQPGERQEKVKRNLLDKTTVYSQGTDGTQIPYVSKENAPEVEGILVIADGGGNAVVVRRI